MLGRFDVSEISQEESQHYEIVKNSNRLVNRWNNYRNFIFVTLR